MPGHRRLLPRFVVLLLALVLLPAVPSVAAPPASAQVTAPDQLTTHAGGSTLLRVPVDGSRRRYQVDVEITKSAARDLGSNDVRVDVETAPGAANYAQLDVAAGPGATVRGTIPLREAAAGAVAVRPTFFVRGDYLLKVTVRDGSRAVALRSAQVQVASAFVPVGVIDANTEIVASTPDGRTVVTTNGDGIGLVDISDPSKPGALVEVAVTQGVTSVDVTPDGKYALVATSSGVLGVVDLASRKLVRNITIPQGGDAVNVSPDGRYAAVAHSADGPQVTGVLAVDLVGEPASWTTREVLFDTHNPAFGGAANPQPENVDIDERNYAAVSFQTTNAVGVFDLASGKTVSLFNLGTATRLFDNSQDEVFSADVTRTAEREPDGIAWAPGHHLLTPNENGGARSWSVLTEDGHVVFDSGADLEQEFSYAGIFRTNDPEFEQVTVASYGRGADAETFALVSSERWGAMAINRIEDPQHPRLAQIVGVNAYDDDPRPEGVYAIPGRDLALVANEDEDTVLILRRSGTVRTTDRPTVTSQVTGWKNIVGWAASGPSSLVAVTGSSKLLHLSVTPTEVLVDDSQPISGIPDALIAFPSTDAVAVDGHGDVWLGLQQQARSSDPVENVLVRLDQGGRVVQSVDLSPGRFSTGTIRAVTASEDGKRLFAVVQDGSAFSLAAYDIARRTVTSWPLPVSDATELIAYGDGDLGVLHGFHDDSAPQNRQETTVVDRVRVAGIPAGQPALVATVADLGKQYGFYGTAGEVGQAAALLPGGDLIVQAPVDRGGFIPAARIRGFDRTGGPAPHGTAALLDTSAQAGTAVRLQLGTDRAAGYQVQVRPAGRGDFVPLDGPGGSGQVPSGKSTVEVRAPAVDGRYDVRAVLMSGTGVTSTATASARLAVQTPSGTVTVTAPSTATPAKTVPAGQFAVRLTTDRAGAGTVQARAAGSATWTDLAVADGGVVPAPGTGVLTATAPGADGTYDLRVAFRAGGAADPSTVDIPAGLTLSTPPAPTVTVSPNAASPFTTWAGGAVDVKVTTDVQASVVVELRGPDGSVTQIPGLAGATFTGTRTVRIDAPLVDGAYEVGLTATNAAGKATQLTEPAALVVSTPAPAVRVVSPALPVTTTAGQTYRPVFEFNQTGTWVLDVRPAGSGDDAWVRDPNFATPRTIQDGQLQVSISLQAPRVDGTYDLRVGFVNEAGTTVQQVFGGAVVVNTPAPTVTVSSPTPQAPVTRPAGGTVQVRLTVDQVVTAEFAVRPAGDDAAGWVSAGSAQVNGQGTPLTVNARLPFLASGAYDLRVTATNLVGGVAQTIVPGAVVVDNPVPTVNLDEPDARRALYRRPGTAMQTLIQTSGLVDFRFEYAPAGTDQWTLWASGQISSSRYQPATVPDVPGAYDLRVTVTNADGETGVDLEPKAMYVGKGPGSPLVINEIKPSDGSFIELRNISDAPLDASGWILYSCRQDELPGVHVSGGAVLPPGGRWLIAGNDYTADASHPEPNQRSGVPFSNSGTELYRPDLTKSDAVGAEPSQGCWEGAPMVPVATGQSWSRDAAGTDTDDNARDLTGSTPTPGS